MDKQPINKPSDQDDMAEDNLDTSDIDSKQSMKEFVNEVQPLQQQRRRKKITSIVLTILFLILVAAGGWYYFNKTPPSQPTERSDSATMQSEEKVISADTVTYESPQFFLSFKHPSDWEVVDERGTGMLKVTSPLIDIPMDGESVSGKVVFSIRSKTDKLEEFEGGNGLAVMESEKITYSNASQSQRGETHITFVSYAGSVSSALIDGVYITGDFGYQKDQAVPKVDIQKIDPIINLSFVSCDGSCTVKVAIPPTSWQQQNFGGQLKTLLQSLRIN